jgi:aldehyde dehydrogenase (NAD+)
VVFVHLERQVSGVSRRRNFRCAISLRTAASVTDAQRPTPQTPEQAMREQLNFYIDGKWVAPAKARAHDVINPANEEPVGRISLGSVEDVNKAVAAARRAFETYSRTTLAERAALLDKIIAVFQKRMGDVAQAISSEMGAPMWLASSAQAGSGLGHFIEARKLIDSFEWEYTLANARILREPIGVVGMITPWNWPVNQIACKVAPALAAGCTMVLKPSELAPLNAIVLAEILDEAGVPPGVFNLINGDGPGVGAALSAHPDIDMMSFTGSTRAGIAVSKAGADTVKRIALELGGKSPNIILDDEAFAKGVAGGVRNVMTNSGQSCNAPTRMLVPSKRMGEAIEVAKEAASQITVGDPNGNSMLGPVVSETQWNKIQGLIQKGIDEGATLVVGGPGRPEGLEKGYYVKPTVFANVTNDMTIAKEEIFGPVLSILGYETLDEAIKVGNDTEYGLAAYVNAADIAKAREVASKLRAGQVSINGGGGDLMAPFGGYKMSGNGREWGDYAFHEFLETKAMLGYAPKQAAE